MHKKKEDYNSAGSYLLLVFAITVLSVMGVSSITPAFPSIKEKFYLTTGEVSLLITIFALPGIILTPFYGILLDRMNRKKVLISVLIIYGVFGSLISITVNFKLILLFRFIQGIGNAPLTTISLTLISDRYRDNKRNTFMGYNASVLSISTALFPAIGGALAMLSWYSPFLLSLLAIMVGIAAIFILNDIKIKHKLNIKDYFKKAFLNMRNSYIVALYLCTFIVFCVLFGSFLTYFNFFLSDIFSLHSTGIGLTITFMSLATAMVGSQLGKLLKLFKSSLLIMVAFILYGISLAIIPFIQVFALIFAPVLIFGIAQGLAIPIIQILITQYAPNEQRAVFLSFYSVVMNAGAAFGPIIAGLFFRLYGYKGSFTAGTVLSIFALIIFIVMQKKKLYNA